MLMNLLIGALVEVVSAVASVERVTSQVNAVNDQLNAILLDIDRDTEVMILMRSLAVGCRAVLLIVFVLTMMVYVLANMLTQIPKGSRLQEELFPNAPQAIFSLTLGAVFPAMMDMALVLGSAEWFFAFLFLVFVVLSTTMFMNLLIGALVEVVSAVASVERETSQVNAVKDQLNAILLDIDRDTEVVIIMRSLAIVCRTVLLIVFVLTMIVYIFAVRLTQIPKGSRLQEEYFLNVPQAVFSLTLGAILPDMREMTQDLGATGWIFAFLFLVFVELSTIMFVNLLIGALVEVVSAVASVGRETSQVNGVKDQVTTILLGHRPRLGRSHLEDGVPPVHQQHQGDEGTEPRGRRHRRAYRVRRRRL